MAVVASSVQARPKSLLGVALGVLFFCVEEWVECRREKGLQQRIEEYILGVAWRGYSTGGNERS
jgi:hypothetical protein